MSMVKKTFAAFVLVATAASIAASPASAEFGLSSFDVQAAAGPGSLLTETRLSEAGGAFTQAGGHPYGILSHLEWNSHPDPTSLPPNQPTPDGDLRGVIAELPLGLVGNPNAYPQCTTQELASKTTLADPPECPFDSQIGVAHVQANTLRFYEESEHASTFPLWNMVPPEGLAARFAFDDGKTLIFLDGALVHRADGSYGIAISSRSPQALRVVGIDITFWGVPADERHYLQRCSQDFVSMRGDLSHAECEEHGASSNSPELEGPHHSGVQPAAFLTLPTSCTPQGVGQPWVVRTSSWENPDHFVEETVHSHLPPYAPESGAPGPQEGTTGCERVPFNPDLSASPTQQSATSATGLHVRLAIPQEGLLNPDGIAQSDLKKAVVKLPEGVSINPSQAEGLHVCSKAEFEAASVDSFGCPSTAKVGSVEVKTPLLDQPIPGNVYVATPYENPFDSLLALYVVLREPHRGIAIGLPGKVDLDPMTGQITTTFDDLPQVPFESFELSFREGPRSPLVTPQACGRYTTESEFYPWARPNEPVTTLSSFDITSGVGGGPCPSGGLPPFKPGLLAGTVNNRAGSYSPFDVRLFRSDEEQEFTNFSLKLPPGVVGKIAGLGTCSDAAIALARSREGQPGGGAEEIRSPSCPQSSEVGRTVVGAGVGSVQAYAPGRLYYAGPYHGSAISLVSITAAKVGPFDLGTVVVRFAIRVNPVTAEIFVDSTGSDPIPHIIRGVTVHLRDVRAYVDRPEFVLNPTSCSRTSVASTVLGSGLDFASSADDHPVTVATPFQAADCAALGFKPSLKLKLSGQLKRAGNPKLQAIYTPRPGDANLEGTRVALPHSEFLDQGHIGTVCTRVQFNQAARPGEACPAASVYGYARAITPLLYAPLEGPIFLRSNPERELPDLVAALHAPQFDINAIAHIDSVGNGQLRATFEALPDAPLTKVVITMAGGKKGLLENSRNLCRTRNRANVEMTAQNGVVRASRPLVEPMCGRKGKKKAGKKSKGGQQGAYRASPTTLAHGG
jgi:hypothetical protein